MELRDRTALRRRARLALALAAAAAALAPAPAQGADDLEIPHSQTKAPPGYDLTARAVVRLARETDAVRSQRRVHERIAPTAYTAGNGRWQVSWFADDDEVAQVIVSDANARVLEQWTGHQVAWKMARGYEGAFGRKVNAPYVWLPLCLLLLIPFVDPRRPLRMVHLDLLVLLALGVSHFFFNQGRIDLSVPLAYPVLLYFLGRCLWLGFRPRAHRDPLVPLVPLSWLVVAILFLVGFRVALNIADSNVIDVGYAGVIGADRIMDGEELYGEGFHDDVGSGDTYGPVNYLVYVPFEQALSWSGSWDGLPAAHAAAIVFDLAVLAGLFVLGRRLRAGPEGSELGVALAFAWAALPYSAFALESNVNDALVGALLVWALVAIASPPLRGALAALAGLTKFAPLALAPLLARGADEGRGRGYRGRAGGGDEAAAERWRHGWRGTAVYALAFAAVSAVLVLPLLPDGGFKEVFDRTIGYQFDRESPFSIWGQYPRLGLLQTIVQAGAIALAVVVAVVPRRRNVAQVAALAVAVLIALQLGVSHWFYLYVAWFAPLLLVAVFAPYAGTTERRRWRPARPVP